MSQALAKLTLINCVVLLLILMSALMVTWSVHEARQLTAESQQLWQISYALQTEWAQLQLEHSTWGNYLRVEQLAGEKLGMHMPEHNERVVIRP